MKTIHKTLGECTPLSETSGGKPEPGMVRVQLKCGLIIECYPSELKEEEEES